jgi:hypothetical protein
LRGVGACRGGGGWLGVPPPSSASRPRLHAGSLLPPQRVMPAPLHSAPWPAALEPAGCASRHGSQASAARPSKREPRERKRCASMGASPLSPSLGTAHQGQKHGGDRPKDCRPDRFRPSRGNHERAHTSRFRSRKALEPPFLVSSKALQGIPASPNRLRRSQTASRARARDEQPVPAASPQGTGKPVPTTGRHLPGLRPGGLDRYRTPVKRHVF